MNDSPGIGKQIKVARDKQRLSQEYVARKVGIDPSHLSRIEAGKQQGSIRTVQMLADFLGISIDAQVNAIVHRKDTELDAFISYLIQNQNDLRRQFIVSEEILPAFLVRIALEINT